VGPKITCLTSDALTDTVSTRDIETTIFDPASEFLNFLYLVYLLYCYLTPVIYESPDCSFYQAVSFYVSDSHCFTGCQLGKTLQLQFRIKTQLGRHNDGTLYCGFTLKVDNEIVGRSTATTLMHASALNASCPTRKESELSESCSS
jgi:hypothetical protein